MAEIHYCAAVTLYFIGAVVQRVQTAVCVCPCERHGLHDRERDTVQGVSRPLKEWKKTETKTMEKSEGSRQGENIALSLGGPWTVY